MLRYFTAGETHGKCLTAIVEGVPAGFKINVAEINNLLARRQLGHGRGGRMLIEKDSVEILSGVRGGVSMGGPIAMRIANRDWENWSEIMGTENANSDRFVEFPRPGHADLSGALKYNHKDLRNVLERASARETAARVAVGALVRQIIEPFGITLKSRVVSVGEVSDTVDVLDDDAFLRAEKSPVGFCDSDSEKRAMDYIDKIKADGESCGGVVETVVFGAPAGLGSYVHYDRKLDARLAFSVMSVQAIKGVEIGMGFDAAKTNGSNVHDEIVYDNGFCRVTNNAGGIEGGMSNGEPIVVRAAMKPIPTLYNPLRTASIIDKTEHTASVERSDACAIYACAVVVEAASAFEIANAFCEKFGGDCYDDIRAAYDAYIERVKNF